LKVINLHIDKEYCEKYGFKVLTFQEVLEAIFLKEDGTCESSNNQLFDEFWTGY
jgi:hypothetical protein